MVENIKGEFTFRELIIIREAIKYIVEMGVGIDELKAMIRVYDKVDGYIDKLVEEMDKNK